MVRQKIKASQLVNRLQNYALAKFKDEKAVEKIMSDGQVRAAMGLLAKCIPDLQRTDLNAKVDSEGRQIVEIRFVGTG